MFAVWMKTYATMFIRSTDSKISPVEYAHPKFVYSWWVAIQNPISWVLPSSSQGYRHASELKNVLAQMWTAFFTEGVEPVHPSIAEVSDCGPVPLKQPVQQLLIKIAKSSKLVTRLCFRWDAEWSPCATKPTNEHWSHCDVLKVHPCCCKWQNFFCNSKGEELHCVHGPHFIHRIGEGRSKVIVTKGEAKAVF